MITWHEDHIMPVDDLREHEMAPACWCHPTKDDESGAWVHHSMDQRELYETMERLKS